MKRVAFLAAVSCLFLGGCSHEPPLTAGVVLSKEHAPEKKWVQVVYVRRAAGTPKHRATYLVPVPMFRRRPEYWQLVIEGVVQVEGEPRTKRRELYVSREAYESVSVGDRYVMRESDKTEVSIEKRRATNQEKLAYGTEPADP